MLGIDRIRAALWLYLCLLWRANVQCLQQIYYKTIDESFNQTYDPRKHLYPVVNLETTCPFIPVATCRDDTFYWKQFEETCHLSNFCPNGTRAQCVENKGNIQFKLLLVCAPTGNCNADARNIVYFDENKPDRYQLGQERCEAGYRHARNVICFGQCELDTSIVVLQKATLTSRALVYCNYNQGYCNPKKPKIFELSSESNVCLLFENLPTCPVGKDRLSDCSCDKSCPNDSYDRDPYSDFRCKRNSSTVLVSASNVKLIQVKLQPTPHTTGLQLSYSIFSQPDISVNVLKITYRRVGRHRALALPDIALTDDRSPRHVDIDSLYPGQTYWVTLTLFYEQADKMKNHMFSVSATTKPKPVMNLTSVFKDKNRSMEVLWKAPLNSKQDTYRIEHRMVRRNRKPAWSYNTTRQCNFTIVNVFPGEEYEARVYSTSSGTDSVGSTTGLIIPPLPPQELHVHFQSLSPIDVVVVWYMNTTRSHVEKWSLMYNCSHSDSNYLDVPYPDHSGRVVARITNVQAGHTYTVLVYSVVGGITSNFPAQLEVKIPSKEEQSGKSELSRIAVGIIIVLVVLLIGVVFLVVVHVCKKVPVIRNIRNTFNIDRIETRFFGGSDINVKIGDNVGIPLNNEAASKEGNSDDDES